MVGQVRGGRVKQSLAGRPARIVRNSTLPTRGHNIGRTPIALAHHDYRIHYPSRLPAARHGRHAPECPARLRAIDDQLIASGLSNFLVHADAPLAHADQLARVHDAGYIAAIEAASPRTGAIHLDPDTVMCPDTLVAARRAAGAAVHATDMVMNGEVQSAFCSVRPPGHHAERGRAMGFCIFNNVAVAAAHALDHHGLERVAIADFDVHHGNGTEEIFRGRRPRADGVDLPASVLSVQRHRGLFGRTWSIFLWRRIAAATSSAPR